MMWTRQKGTHNHIAASYRHKALLDQSPQKHKFMRELLSQAASDNSLSPVHIHLYTSSITHLEIKTLMDENGRIRLGTLLHGVRSLRYRCKQEEQQRSILRKLKFYVFIIHFMLYKVAFIAQTHLLPSFMKAYSL